MKGTPAPTSTDGRQYVWDWCNDRYVRLIPPNHERGSWGWDTEEPHEHETVMVSARQLMAAFSFVLGKDDTRSEEELDEMGDATIWYDTQGRPIAFFHHQSGIVASVPEWANVDWQQVDIWWGEVSGNG